MLVLHRIDDLRQHLKGQHRVAFVPTMGNLHQGHLELVRTAKKHGNPVVVSIFVNPLQFGQNEDFSTYPRTLEQDIEKLKNEGVYILFAPHVDEMYPEAQNYRVLPPPLAQTLEGEFRPHFFEGVCTVVTKLFACVQPLVAVFGKKDYQQLFLVRQMCRQLSFPMQIIAQETIRDLDGLALSSRNQYLSADERAIAPMLYQQLQLTAEHIQHTYTTDGIDGTHAKQPINYTTYLQQAWQTLEASGWVVDYIRLCNTHTLQEVDLTTRKQQTLVILAAARLGNTRLIDNLEFSV